MTFLEFMLDNKWYTFVVLFTLLCFIYTFFVYITAYILKWKMVAAANKRYNETPRRNSKNK